MAVTLLQPHDTDAEMALVASLLRYPKNIDQAIEYVVVEDFYGPKLRAMFLAAVQLYLGGERVDGTTVKDECHRQGFTDVEGADVMRVLSEDGGPQWRRYADIVIGHSMRRRLLAEGTELISAARDLTRDPREVLESHLTIASSITSALVRREPDDVSVEDFMRRPESTQAKWVIPGIIRERWRIMVVAGEGSGKSWLLRFLAICAAYGIHPWRHVNVPPMRTLIVDLENPEDQLRESFDRIMDPILRKVGHTETTNRLWWKPSGINLRNRADLAAFENVIDKRRPQLICIGPLYHAYEATHRDSWEDAARDVQQAINKLRKRYDFALILEDHAPQSSSGNREIRPYGSSLWRRWPEIGIGMEPLQDSTSEFELKRWRGDRVKNEWPRFIRRGEFWPFEDCDQEFGVHHASVAT